MKLTSLIIGTEYAINTSENNRNKDDIEFGTFTGIAETWGNIRGRQHKVATFDIGGCSFTRRYAPQFIVATREQYEIDHAEEIAKNAAQSKIWKAERDAQKTKRDLAIRLLRKEFGVMAERSPREGGVLIKDSDLVHIIANLV